ncbi:MAG TPA: glycoside hydrolase family 5 protein [Polyangiaceae bacterium]|nr:glycoside hydrolase family 5 protein [Polyangiaceae bacterium]
MKPTTTHTFSLLTAVFLFGCSGSEQGTGGGAGGSTASASGGTQSSSGGSQTASGGSQTSSGGSSTSGGTSTASGGATSSGGSSSASGGTASGGGSTTSATGGAPSAGSGGAPTDPNTPVALHGPLKVMGTSLVDSKNAPVQLKGPSSMWLNWETKKFAEDKQGLAWMRDNWKASVIRAAMGVDTTDTDDYLSAPDTAKAQVNTIVQNAIDNGMYVIIDWHDGKADQHQSEAIAFFTEMATKWGSYPNVIYETFNEPTTQSWSGVLKPYHQAVVAAIRAVDPDNVIVLGTRNWSQYVDEPAADPVPGSNLMYTLHFYSCTHTKAIRDRAEAAFGKGLPIFVTEWGATHADGGTPKNPMLCLDEAQLWHDWMNSHKISWAAWKFDACVDQTCYFKDTADPPTNGGWTDDMLNGHATFVRDRMKE